MNVSTKKLFGTDGIRAEAGQIPLDEATVSRIGASLGRNLAEKLGRPPRIVTGRDTRESGEWIENALLAGAAESGAVLASAGVITTPGVAFVARSFGFDAGVVISASHNPFEDNGIKVFRPTGQKLDAETEAAIEADVFAEHQPAGDPQVPAVDRGAEGRYQTAYVDHLASQFPQIDLSRKKIVIDCANGAASLLAPRLFSGLGAEVLAINDLPDGRNINLECGSLHLEQLQGRVLSERADLGVAFDGDADRCLLVDEKGSVVDGDATLWILAQFLKGRGSLKSGRVVATVMSNIGLEIALSSIGLHLLRTAVGDKYVLDELVKSGSELGGEQSGHIILPAKSLVGDGMLTALYVLEALYERRIQLSDAVTGFKRYPQVLVNVKVKEKLPFDEVDEIAAAAREVEQQLDGTGRLLLRYSGTENLARVMIEGKHQDEIERQATSLAGIIRDRLG